eukprot:m.66016 g.66016  ORF g.66016 m.66016 type:complete len:1662 (+) comp35354_c0_seq6:51-5036(+)
MGDFKVLYYQNGVCIYPPTSDSEETIIGGSLKLQKDSKNDVAFVEWTPVEPFSADVFCHQDWMIVSSPGESGQRESPRSGRRVGDSPRETRLQRFQMQFALSEVKSVRKKQSYFGFPECTFTLVSNESMPTLHFHKGRMKDFWSFLQRFLCLEKSKHDASLYVVTESATALRKSMQGLNFDEEDTVHLTSNFSSGFTEVMGGLSKVTRFIKGALGSKGPLEDKRPTAAAAAAAADASSVGRHLRLLGGGLLSLSDTLKDEGGCSVESYSASAIASLVNADVKKKTPKKVKEMRMKSGGGRGKKNMAIFEESEMSAPMEPISEGDETRVRRKLFTFIGKKEVPKIWRFRNLLRTNQLTQLRKIAIACQKEQRKRAAKSQKRTKDATSRAKRLMKEVLVYWKKFEKVERDQRKKAEKEALEQKKLMEEMREARRQQRKLNFLITQTELYAHFMAKKLTGDKESSEDKILKKLEEAPMQRQLGNGGVVTLEADEDFDINNFKTQAMCNVQQAVQNHEAKTREYNAATHRQVGRMQEKFDERFSLANPSMNVGDAPQPSSFDGQLKSYQLRGMNWLASLYHQGINGILADEMGLGKTVQSIALLAHLAEKQHIWGPFLVVAPASTLHNWQQEVTRFVPAFKVLPYWGTATERKILRKFWNQDKMTVYSKDAPFHILITSYQLVIADVRYFQRIQWQYMILDEAQAIKSTSSVRWKMLLGFKCRNRLLLTGTPIQNTMAELWALLHFIMPTLFDSHAEFNEWFSKDIESHAEKKSGLDENQLSRLHLILKPFMLRRVKKDVENEMADKIEIQLMCLMTERQRRLYRRLRNKITIEELLASTSTAAAAQASSNTLMNLVMQFRKVCNHPELFERRDVQSPYFLQLPPYQLPVLLHNEEMVGGCQRERKKLLYSELSVWSPENIHQSRFSTENEPSCFSFLRFIDTSPSEASAAMLAGFQNKLIYALIFAKLVELVEHRRTWWEKNNRLSNKEFHIIPCLSSASVRSLPVFQKLIFASRTSPVTSHETHKILRSIYSRSCGMQPVAKELQKVHTVTSPILVSPSRGGFPFSPKKLSSPTKPVAPSTTESQNTDNLQDLLCDPLLPPEMTTTLEIRELEPTAMPSFLVCCSPKAFSSFVPQYCVSRSSQNERDDLKRSGYWKERRLLTRGVAHRSQVLSGHLRHFSDPDDTVLPASAGPSFDERGICGCMPQGGWFSITIPDKDSLIIDSGKLSVLDRLLAKLKREGHRVLIYSQMTRMIDLLEEYMWYRKHKYIRLDGSSKIADRRDMVADFQTRSDLFVFLLSTRAGGLGINLTAADTVIFYDSDWNPTVDQQAMDRAHRLGQTKQVTVYRFVMKDTVEERILQRAKEKSEIQKMVISGGHFKPDALKPKEVVSLLLDDAEMENKFLQKQAEQEQAKRRRNKRKKTSDQTPASEAGDSKKTKSLPPVPFLDNLLGSPSLSSRPPSVMSSRSALSNDFNDVDLDLSIVDDSGPAPVDDIPPPVGDVSLPFFGDSAMTHMFQTSPGTGKGRGKGQGRAKKTNTDTQSKKRQSKAGGEPQAKKRATKKNTSGEAPPKRRETKGKKGRGGGGVSEPSYSSTLPFAGGNWAAGDGTHMGQSAALGPGSANWHGERMARDDEPRYLGDTMHGGGERGGWDSRRNLPSLYSRQS